MGAKPDDTRMIAGARTLVRTLLACCLGVSFLWPGTLAAQELPFRTAYPGSAPHECPAWSPPPSPDRKTEQAARELLSNATQSVVLGDLERARDLYREAVELDGSAADLHYGLARVLEDLGQQADAIEAYCRVLELDTREESIQRDAELRKDALNAAVRESIPFGARMSFERAAGSAGRGSWADAARYFAAAESQSPGWTQAVYNHGVALARAGQYEAAAERLRRYLELDPESEHAVQVARRIGQLEMSRPMAATRSDAALTLGLVVPGLGQFSSGRSMAGLLVLSAATGAVATGFLVKEVDVRCLRLPAGGGRCPPDQVVSRTTSRPLLGKSLVVAGAISLLGALEAWLRTDDEAQRGPVVADRDGLALEAPSLSMDRNGTVQLVLLGLSLR